MATITANKEKDMHTITLTSDQVATLRAALWNAKEDAGVALDMPQAKAYEMMKDANQPLVALIEDRGEVRVELTTEQALTIQRAATYMMTTTNSKAYGQAAFAMLAQTHGVA
jgi:hypothetical protein